MYTNRQKGYSNHVIARRSLTWTVLTFVRYLSLSWTCANPFHSLLVFGLTCPANDPNLVNGKTESLQSPMTVALENAGFRHGSDLINVFIFLTCLSACNSSIYIGSRTVLYVEPIGKRPTRNTWPPRGVSHGPSWPFSRIFPCLKHLLTLLPIRLGTWHKMARPQSS
jgi:hypothetical protein